jgi:hypothetical protein
MSYESVKNEEIGAGVVYKLEQKEKDELRGELYTYRDEEKAHREKVESGMINDGFDVHTDDKMEIELVDIENLSDEELILFQRLRELEEKDATINDINEFGGALDEYHNKLKIYLDKRSKKENYSVLDDPRENFYAWIKNKLAKVQLGELHRRKEIH